MTKFFNKQYKYCLSIGKQFNNFFVIFFGFAVSFILVDPQNSWVLFQLLCLTLSSLVGKYIFSICFNGKYFKLINTSFNILIALFLLYFGFYLSIIFAGVAYCVGDLSRTANVELEFGKKQPTTRKIIIRKITFIT